MVFDVRMITSVLQELGPVFAVNLLNGTLPYLAEGICQNVTLHSRNHSIQFLLKDCKFQLACVLALFIQIE